jgi:putative oxidoreductase
LTRFELKSERRSLKVARMALQFLGKYRETGLLLIRVSIGLIFIILIVRVLWNGHGSWEHFGAAMRHLDFHSHFQVWGFIGALAGCAGGVLMILGLFFRIGVLCALVVTLVYVVALRSAAGGFYRRLPAIEMSILLLSLLFIGPGTYSVDKS